MSSFLDFSVKDKTQLGEWIMRKLGYPLNTVEITAEQIEDCIDDSVEFFTKYVQFDRKSYAINIKDYDEGIDGIKLPSDIASVFSMTASINGSNDASQLFSMSNVMLNMGMLPHGFNIGGGSGWLNYEMAQQFLNQSARMMNGGTHSSGGFMHTFNNRTGVLSLTPSPLAMKASGMLVVGCNVIREENQLFGEKEIKELSLANAMIQLSVNRHKFIGTALIGGGSVNDNMGSDGKALKEKIEADVIKDQGVFSFFVS